MNNLDSPVFQLIKTRVVYKDGTVYSGFFKAFDDHESLRSEGIFRFIPEDKLTEITDEYAKTKVLNKSSSLMINIQMVEDIEVLKK